MSTEKEFGVFVFSYNRGPHLDRCLQSVSDNAPARFVRVYDDGSDDPATVDVLRRWASRIDVVRVDRSADNEAGRGDLPSRMRGGLNANMERAFEYARDAGVDFALMLQDDMQVVRRVDREDVDGWRSFFEANGSSMELYASFDYHVEASPSEWHLDDTGVAFLANRPITSDAYSDTGLFHVGRYWEMLGELRPTEFANTQWLYSRGIVKGRLAVPFTMFMPYPRTTRKRDVRDAVKAWLSEWLANSGVHPFAYMSDAELARLRRAKLDAPPLARAWLSCPTMNHRATWSYFGGARDLRACGGLRSVAGEFLGGRPPLHSRLTEPRR